MKSNKKALLFFYKKMDNITEQGMIEFNSTKIGKNMEFRMTSKYDNNLVLFIKEDFGFKGCYPMISKESLINIETFTSDKYNAIIYIVNFYDKLDNNELYEDEREKYFTYIFDSGENYLPIFNSEAYNINEPVYIDNLLSLRFKNNMQIIPGNSTCSIVLNLRNGDIYFQFYICKNKEIKFTAENSNGYFFLKILIPTKKL